MAEMKRSLAKMNQMNRPSIAVPCNEAIEDRRRNRTRYQNSQEKTAGSKRRIRPASLPIYQAVEPLRRRISPPPDYHLSPPAKHLS